MTGAARLRVVGAFVAVLFRSLSRDRTALFFMIVLPIIVIVVIGSAFGGQARVELGLVVQGTGPTTEALVDELERRDGLSVQRYDDVDGVEAAIRTTEISAAVVLPAGLDEPTRTDDPVDVGFLARAGDQGAFVARVAVGGAVDAAGARVGAALVVAEQLGTTYGDAFTATAGVGSDEGAAVEVVDIGGGVARDVSRFSLVAPQNLVLFVFITSLSAGAFLVSVRRAGVLRRVASTATTTSTAVAGLAVGWFAMALVQSAIVLVIGAVAFDVDWGDPLGAALLTVTFAAVGASAGLLLGAIGRDEDKVSSLAPIVGIVLGALGGCMVPLEVFPPAMVAVAHVVPQYWAVVGWQELVFDGGGAADIAGSLVVLTAFAVVLLVAATVTLRRQIARG